MDLLLKRYASPYLLEESITTGSMAEFINDFVDIVNKEVEEDTLWQYFLHKVFDKSYQEWMNEVNKPKIPDKPVDFETAVNDSYEILNGFVPE